MFAWAILLSVSRDNGKPGVFQYDYGKAVQGRAFEATGVLNMPPQRLLSAVNGLRADYERLGRHQALVEAVDDVLSEGAHQCEGRSLQRASEAIVGGEKGQKLMPSLEI